MTAVDVMPIALGPKSTAKGSFDGYEAEGSKLRDSLKANK